MKKIYLIGIGPGGPDYLTIQAINIMKKIDVFFILEKEGNIEFPKMRLEILKRYLDKDTYRVVTAKVPKRPKSSPYKEGVEPLRPL
ncbi:MAG: SAM-dependent methyltransferase [bacterium]